MSHLGFNVMQFPVAHHPHLVPHCWSVLGPTCTAVVPLKLSQGVCSPAVFCSKDVAMNPSIPLGGFCELFRSIWIIPFFPKQLIHHLACTLVQGKRSIPLKRCCGWIDALFGQKGAEWYQIGPSSCSWKQFRLAVWYISWWRNLMAGWMFVWMIGQKFSLKGLVSPILQTFALPSKQELFDHCFLLLELGLHSVGVVLVGEPLCFINTMLK